jgi:hypothetical protein
VRVSHRVSAGFDDPNLVSCAGWVPALTLAEKPGLHDLAAGHVRVPGPVGSNPAVKVVALVAGMVAGARTFDAMDLLRHGGMGRVFTAGRAPSTLGTFLRACAFGYVRQLDAVASRFLVNLVRITPLLSDVEEIAYLDIASRRQGNLRVSEARRRVRILRGQGLERPARDHLDPDGGAGDRGHPVAERLDELSARGRPAGGRRPGHRGQGRGQRSRHRQNRQRLLRASGGGRGPARRGPVLRDRAWTRP